jgi:DNA-binding XRE family transcriptional regulator
VALYSRWGRLSHLLGQRPTPCALTGPLCSASAALFTALGCPERVYGAEPLSEKRASLRNVGYLLKMNSNRPPLDPVRQFGLRVEVARLCRGMTQQEASLRSGVPQPHLSRIEQGLVEPGLVTVLRIAQALELDPGVLLWLLDGRREDAVRRG